jgi:HK97 family phage portal protein
VEVILPFWDFLRKQENDVAVAVPLNFDVGQATYPDASFENFASEGYGKSEIVHACIRELAVSAAAPRYYVQAPATDGGAVEVTSGLLYDLTTRPNPNSDWYSFIESLVTFLMVAGNSYVLKERSRSGKVMALYHLRPDRVRIIGGDHGAAGYIYSVSGTDYSLPVEDVCHLALPNPGGDLYGLSPLQVLARNVNLDLNMTDFAKVYFQNAGVPSGLLKLKRRLNTQEEASVIRSRWRSQFGGRNNFHRIAILDEDADYVPMANNPKDMALPELHDLTESRICAVFGVPAILVGANVGLQRSTYSNYREARMAFHSETLEPMVSRILRHFNRNMFAEYPGNEMLTVDWAQMRSGLDDREAMTTRVTGLFAGGILTLNEAREQLGLEAVDDGAVRRIPSSVFEVGEGAMAPIAVDEAPVEESLSIDTLKETVKVTALKAPRVARRAGLLRRQMLEDREEETDALSPRVQRYFRGLRNRVDGILGRWMERTTDSKEFPPGFPADDLLPTNAIPDLTEIIRRAMERMSKRTVDAINANGLAGTLEWSERLPFVQAVLVQAPTRATMIHRTTNRTISRAVAMALERGYSIEQLARGVPDDQFPGLRSILTETEKRARMIARTEIMKTQNATSIGFFKEQGFAYVRADDVDGDPDDNYIDPGDGRTCIQRHGQIYTVEDAGNIDDHPNGTLNWQPMPRDYRPEETV